MVTYQTKDDISINVTKLTYSMKTKASGYLSGVKDRSECKLFIMKDSFVDLCVKSSKGFLGHRKYDVEIDYKSHIEENTIDIDALHNSVEEYLTEKNSVDSNLILDDKYRIFGVGNALNDYAPYNMDKRDDILELNISNSYNMISSLFDEKSQQDYFIYMFPDLISSADRYSLATYIGILVKNYIESKFAVIDKNRLNNKQIISFPAFQLIFHHLKDLFHVKFSNTYTIRTTYDTLSRLNLLPNIPQYTWWLVEQQLSDLNVDRIKSIYFPKNKKKDEEKPKEKVYIKNTKMYIPEYLTNEFDEDYEVMNLSDFETAIINMEIKNSRGDYNAFNKNIIIASEGKVCGINPDEIIFLGFDGYKFYIVLKSDNNSNKLTPKEREIDASLKNFFYIKFGYTVDVTFDIDDEKQTVNEILMPYNNRDDYFGDD